MNTDMRKELKLLHSIFMDKITYLMNTPIVHLIDRNPGYTIFVDTYLEACGDFSRHPQFWWYFEFPQEIKKPYPKILHRANTRQTHWPACLYQHPRVSYRNHQLFR